MFNKKLTHSLDNSISFEQTSLVFKDRSKYNVEEWIMMTERSASRKSTYFLGSDPTFLNIWLSSSLPHYSYYLYMSILIRIVYIKIF